MALIDSSSSSMPAAFACRASSRSAFFCTRFRNTVAPAPAAVLIPAPATPPIPSAIAESNTRIRFSLVSTSPFCSPMSRSPAMATASCAPPVRTSSPISLGARRIPALTASLTVLEATSVPSSLSKLFLRMVPAGPARSSAPEAMATIAVVSLVFCK